jgi:hypothetical protein
MREGVVDTGNLTVLNRPPASPDRRRDRWRNYRARREAGIVMVSVPVDAALVGLLVKLDYLPPREMHTRAEIADALHRMHVDAVAE